MHGKATFFPPKAKSLAAVLWRAWKIKEPPTDPAYCLALLPSISSTPQSASYMCISCLLGLWQTRPLHLFAYAWAVHVWIQIADGERRQSHCQALFITMLREATAQQGCKGKRNIGRVYQRTTKLGILIAVDSS